MAAGSYNGYGAAIATSVRDEITTTRVRDDIVTTMTNISTKSDAWGKVIPMGFGRHRVGGALVWASQFYKTTETYSDVTTKKNIVHWLDTQNVVSFPPGGNIQNTVINTEFDVTRSSGSQVTTGTFEDAFIDLCYSFGIEGDTRKKRFIEKVRINDTVVYDTSIGFVADGIAFSIRYGYDNAPPALLEKYPNGKFHYKGHTLICFEKFPLSLFGNSIPDNVDIEWGCCGFETGGNQCQLQAAYTYYGSDPFSIGAGSGPYTYQEGDLLIFVASDAGAVNTSKFGNIVSGSFAGKAYKSGVWVLSSGDAASLNSAGYQMTTAKCQCLLRVFNTNINQPMLSDLVRQAAFTAVAAGASYSAPASGSLGYGLSFAFAPDGTFTEHGGFVGTGSLIGAEIDGVAAPGGGWLVYSSVVASPCVQIG